MNGHTYVIGPDESYISRPQSWSYPLPDPRCTDNYAQVVYYETTPGLGEGINGGGTQNGPHDPAAMIDWAILGTYTGRTTWTCTIDAPPVGHPAGDYIMYDQPLDTITYHVRKHGEDTPELKEYVAVQRETDRLKAALRLCASTATAPGSDCYVVGHILIAIRDTNFGANKPGSHRRSANKRSKWVKVGRAEFAFDGDPDATVLVPLKRPARKVLKKRGSLNVRVTVRARVEGGAKETVRKKAKLKLPD